MEVITYTIETGTEPQFTHWAEGLNMIITKDGVTIELTSEEILKIINSLPRTIGGTY